MMDIVKEIVIGAPPLQVWNALTKENELATGGVKKHM